MFNRMELHFTNGNNNKIVRVHYFDMADTIKQYQRNGYNLTRKYILNY